ncbi:MAG: FMN-binding glutamate synthase family protein [Caldicoprobacterales bacterium]|jgi:glutamate synthase domain-containing protein 2
MRFGSDINKNNLKKALIVGIGASMVGVAGARLIARTIVNKISDRFYNIISKDLYDENLWELISSTLRMTPQVAMETNLRATEAKMLERPMGTAKKMPSLDSLQFNVAQLHTMPTDTLTEIETQVTIGKRAAKPFTIKIPIMIAPMAYGVALSKKVKLALARGARMAGTATNSGEGAFLPEEREEAGIFIYQYNRGHYGNTPEILQNCDAVEIQFGQGGYGGVGHIVKSELIDRQMRRDFDIPPGTDIIAHSRQPEVQSPEDLPNLVAKLRDITGGAPIGAKIGAGKYMEKDLEYLCESGVDFITVDGAEAATKGSPPIFQDDFGIPTVFAIHRAAQWIRNNGYQDQVSLLVSGKIRTPGEVLKACALGADACYMGSIALFAVSHSQLNKALPYEPPTTLVWYNAHYSRHFDIDKGAKSLNNFLEACRLEIADGIRGLGKTSLAQVNREDLISIDETVAKGCGIPMAYDPYV